MRRVIQLFFTVVCLPGQCVRTGFVEWIVGFLFFCFGSKENLHVIQLNALITVDAPCMRLKSKVVVFLSSWHDFKAGSVPVERLLL